MPNYCHNDLYISGSTEDVAAVLALVGADKSPPEFDFGAVLPYPEQFALMDAEAAPFGFGRARLKDQAEAEKVRAAYIAKHGHDKDGYNSGGYKWCAENWGTKWNAIDVARRDYQGVCVTFQTAWSPPSQLVIALAKRFPMVTFTLEYFERGMPFCGGFQCPAEDDHYGDEKWEAGMMVNDWHTNEYHGHRGG